MLKSRPDATLVSDVHPYRRMMPFLMRTRTESAVYFEQEVDLSTTLAFIDDYNESHPGGRISVFPVIVWATIQTLADHPELNRFTAGGKLWQRNGIWISYAAKKELSEGAGLATLKREFDPTWDFERIVEEMSGAKREGRSAEKGHVDKELDLFLRLPGPLLRLGVRAIRGLDTIGALPRSFVEPDPMYTSVFFANLGSLHMDSAYHHLYEYGNCPIFGVIGQIKDQPAVVDGEVVRRPKTLLRWSYDERVHDGFYAGQALQTLREKVEDPIAGGARRSEPEPGSTREPTPLSST